MIVCSRPMLMHYGLLLVLYGSYVYCVLPRTLTGVFVMISSVI